MVDNKDGQYSQRYVKKLLTEIIAEGQSTGVFRTDFEVGTLVELLAAFLKPVK